MLLCLCVACILKWLNIQPQLIALRHCTLSTEQAIKLVAMEKREKFACMATKALLTSSVGFLVAHFVLVAQ